MDLMHLAQQVIANEPQHMLLAGKCIKDESTYRVYPDPNDKAMVITVNQSDVVDTPIAVKTDIAQLAGAEIQALRVKKGCVISVTHHGESQKVKLQPEQGREMMMTMANPPPQGSCCRVFLEFNCGTGGYMGWCFGWWSCLLPGAKC